MRQNWLFILSLASITAFTGYDLYRDVQNQAPWLHLVVEVGVHGASFSWFIYFLSTYFKESRKAAQRIGELEQAMTVWKQKASTYIQGLSSEIDRQLDQWALTQSEKEVALLLLKGLSTKEIADIRGTAERTIRQHAQSVYAKSGLAGRAELSAFFLEDLLQPIKSI